LDVPTKTKFEHVGPYNMFQLTFLPDTDSLPNNERIERDVVCNNNVDSTLARDIEVQMVPELEVLAERNSNDSTIKVNKLKVIHI